MILTNNYIFIFDLDDTLYSEREFEKSGIEFVYKYFEITNIHIDILLNNRKNSKCSSKAVFNTTGLMVKFDIAHGCDLFSGINETLTCEKHKEWIDKDKTMIDVQTISLIDLLNDNDAPSYIEYLSLDTEGSEYEILKNFDFTKYTFGLIDVEHNFEEPTRTQIRTLLEANGYIYIFENKWDDCYKHNTFN